VAAPARKRRKRRGGEFRQPPQRGQRQPPAQQPARQQPAQSRGRRRPGRERPPAPWGSFPLVELVVLLALVMLTVGFFIQGTRGLTMLVAGITLGALAGLELSIREHFAGYKSHTTVLAGAVTVVPLALGFFFVGWAPAVAFAVAVVVFVAGLYLFREAFKRRSGGLGFR
jgi:hypothetical protein